VRASDGWAKTAPAVLAIVLAVSTAILQTRLIGF